jgi:NADH-quinone oxidoreductase subunit H
MFWFFLKLGAMIALNIWIRGTWPRVRVDQLMGFAWKVLLPMSILNIVVVGLVRFMPNVVVGWIVAAVILFLAFVVLIKFSASQSIEKRTYRYAS